MAGHRGGHAGAAKPVAQRADGSSLRQQGGHDASDVVAGSFAKLPACLCVFACVRKIGTIDIDCPNLLTLPMNLYRR